MERIGAYRRQDNAWIISCYFNSQKYQSRRHNFNVFYDQLQRSGVNFLIAECAFGADDFELPASKNIIRMRSKHPLWQKEAMLNNLVKRLPPCEYVFWLDADVLFTNPDWLVEAVEVLKTKTICQPFSIAVRLEKDEAAPAFDVGANLAKIDSPNPRPAEKTLWRSFAYNFVENPLLANSPIFDVHGHTGFAWGARREILERVPLFDKAIAGTADHIIAHAAAGQIPNQCVERAFTDSKTKEAVYSWSRQFSAATGNKLDYVSGELWHLWHGDLENRQYLSRTRELSRMKFDLDDDLELNDDDLYEVRENRGGIISWITDYFFARREDETTVSDSPARSDASAATDAPSSRENYVAENAPTGDGADFAGGGAGGSWENYS